MARPTSGFNVAFTSPSTGLRRDLETQDKPQPQVFRHFRLVLRVSHRLKKPDNPIKSANV
jgi:hypothetical protein